MQLGKSSTISQSEPEETELLKTICLHFWNAALSLLDLSGLQDQFGIVISTLLTYRLALQLQPNYLLALRFSLLTSLCAVLSVTRELCLLAGNALEKATGSNNTDVNASLKEKKNEIKVSHTVNN